MSRMPSYFRSKIHSGPAMCAAFIRADGTFGGLHLTWLEADMASPPVKAEIVNPDDGEVMPAKKMRGSKTGAHIALTRPSGPEHALRVARVEKDEVGAAACEVLEVAGGRLAFWAAERQHDLSFLKLLITSDWKCGKAGGFDLQNG